MTMTDDQIRAVWDDVKPQGDPTGHKFALAFARAIIAHTAPSDHVEKALSAAHAQNSESIANGWKSAQPVSVDRRLFEVERDAAVATLEHLRYEYFGGEQWKPPIGFITKEQPNEH